MSYVDKVKVGNTTYDIKDGNTYTKEQVNNALAEKVDKVSGKGLSTNDFTNAEKTKLAGIETGARATTTWDDIKQKPTTLAGFGITDAYTKGETYTALSGKVDKVSGKGLSANDFTNVYKEKLDKTNIAYATCDTEGDIAQKEISITNLQSNPAWEQVRGALIVVRFSYTNTAQNPSFNVDGRGTSNITVTNHVVSTYNLEYAGKANHYMLYMYNGTYFTYLGGIPLTDYYNQDQIDALFARTVIFGTCSTDGEIAEKQIDAPAFTDTTVKDGTLLGVYFAKTNTTFSPTFNINSRVYSIHSASSNQLNALGTMDYEYGGSAKNILFYVYKYPFFYYIGGYQRERVYTSAIAVPQRHNTDLEAKCSQYVLRDGNYLHIIIPSDITVESLLYLNVNDTGGKFVYINDVFAKNCTLPAGSYIVYYHDNKYYFRTDGKIPGITAVPVDSYTKGEIDEKLANIEGGTPEWNDVQHKPKTIAGYGITDAYTKSEVDAAIAGIDGGTPDWGDIQNKPTTVAGYGLTDAYTKGQVDTALAGKVDKVSGKGLSTEDFTTAEKTKLAELSNVSDWDDIQNKPTTIAGFGITDAYTKGEVDAAIAGVDVGNPDWSDVQNKPTTLAGYGIADAYTKSETDTALAGKVDAVSGKGLSTNDYTDVEKAKLAGLTSTPDFSDIQNTPTTLAGYGITNAYTKGEVDTELAGKVDVVSGKGLSTNDYTDAEKAKVAAIPGISISGNRLVITTQA